MIRNVARQLDGGRLAALRQRNADSAFPALRHNLNSLIFQGTRMNRVPGEPLFLKDLNCHCIDPNKDFVLNPKAWSDVPQGEWGYSAPSMTITGYARVPNEQFSFGRNFRYQGETPLPVPRRVLQRVQPDRDAESIAGNPLQTPTRNAAGVPTAGFGRIDATSVSGQRNGQIVARVEW